MNYSSDLLSDLPLACARAHADKVALRHSGQSTTYGQLASDIESFAGALTKAGIRRGERVAIYLGKEPRTITAIFGSVHSGAVFVPVNPLLRAPQVQHIIRDCSASVLVTTRDRFETLRHEIGESSSLRLLILLGDASSAEASDPRIVPWTAFMSSAAADRCPAIDQDVAAILYTSGSTGKPKGVILSHRNMVAGARSVATYLQNTSSDVLLAALPLSFDYGFSQLSTAFSVGASVVLLDFLFPRDIIRAVAEEGVTGLAAVPPLWIQLADLPWPDEVATHLRYFTNSGGRMPGATLAKLRRLLPGASPYLMYGLTEAFRATYLPPEEVDCRPDSIGKAIPNAEVIIVRPDGSHCGPNEPGELVQRGSLVALGYWNDPAKTAERFKPVPGHPAELPTTELAVWSGDTVRMDEDGFLYFVGRRDEMIKTSSYRVSPTEVEEIAYASNFVCDAVAIGVPHDKLGAAIVLIASPPEHIADEPGRAALDEKLASFLKAQMPLYMIPKKVIWCESLPRNPNGKFDRNGLAAKYADVLETEQ